MNSLRRLATFSALRKNQYVLLHENGSGFTVFDPDGSVVVDDTAFLFSNLGVSDMLELKDSSFIFVFGGEDCDILINFIVKYDKNWNKVWSEYTNGTGGPIAGFSDNSFIIGYNLWDHMIEKWSNDGNNLWRTDLGMYEIADVAITADDLLFVATHQGLLKLTSDGVVIDTFSNLIFDRLETLPNGNFLASANNMLLLYDSNFAVLASFKQAGHTIQAITFAQNQIALLTNAPEIIRFDLNLNNTENIPLTGHNQTFNALALADSGYIVGGGEQYGNNTHGIIGAFIKEYANNGSTANTNEDIELTSVTQNGQIGVKNYFGIYEIKIPNIDLLVTNKGTAPVHSLAANLKLSDINGLGECTIEQEFTKTFDNLNLQPGASIHLVWDEVKFGSWDNLAGENLDLCLWTSLPNHHLETNNDNDVACAQVTVATQERFPVAFEHYFNPVADELNIALKEQLGSRQAVVRVFNATGQLVHSEALGSQPQSLELGHLPDGAYFLQIVAGQRVGWGRFAKY